MTASVVPFRRPALPEPLHHPTMTAAAMLAALPAYLTARYVVDGECLRWTGATNGHGYGLLTARIDGVRSPSRVAHRAAWEAVNGPIPVGAVLDHYRVGTSGRCIGTLCGLHVAPSTLRLNTLRPGSRSVSAINARKTACAPAGHLYTEENTYRYPDGSRECRTCRANRRHHIAAPAAAREAA